MAWVVYNGGCDQVDRAGYTFTKGEPTQIDDGDKAVVLEDSDFTAVKASKGGAE